MLRRLSAALASGAAAFILLFSSPALSYVGPGAGLSVIGTVLALMAASALAIVGFVWYPVKRLRQKKRGARNSAAQRQSAQGARRG